MKLSEDFLIVSVGICGIIILFLAICSFVGSFYENPSKENLICFKRNGEQIFVPLNA